MLSERLIHTLEQSIKEHWELPAFSDYQGETFTYAQVGWRIAYLHEVFRRSHVKQGDKIALFGKNSANWTISYLAAVTYGAVIVPILPDFIPENVQHIVNHSDAILLFVAETLYENLEGAEMPHLHGVFSLSDFSVLYHPKKQHFEQTLRQAEAAFPPLNNPGLTPDKFALPAIQNDALASIVYTSGTTGFSKGVMLSHNSLIANVLFAQQNMPLVAGDTILSFLPLAHCYGCAFEFLFPFSVGCHITLLNKTPSPKVLLQAFREIRPRLILSVPLILEKIYNRQVKPALNKPIIQFALKLPIIRGILLRKICRKLTDSFGGNFTEIVIGGAALNQEVEQFFKLIKFRVTVGYGMTECGPLISYAPWNQHRPQSSGKTINFLEATIDSEDPRQIAGDILVKGENVMIGYYKDPDATRNTFVREQWLNTGDIGTIDEDGFIYIKGRSKNMILGASGQNIYPEEIEALLNNLPFVQESLVLEKQGKLFALVFPDFDAADAKGVSEAQLPDRMEANRRELNKRLPAYCAVSKIELYPKEFEKTPTRKIKRFLYTIHENVS
ncbi:AMP-dependent synthetase and ligase [Candidatus Moduliflexus flocculans]|uniref:AMP-dependent synthetase and ligase n=1 Tax=Candidatus Moduliflexus flocculans TaxID=1499966 RepID=A0A081BNF4_9BACT|nr:AMP-dependent synthetase and ligase [Candidatus Moduliflexus flocculans]